MKKLLLLILAISIQATAYAADSFSSLEERMSGKEFKETGLGKLTDEELTALNDWLRGHSVATLENAAARPASTSSAAVAGTTEDLRGFENQSKGNPLGGVINSTIIGTFSGWKAKGTLFKLANGMVWQQSERDTFYIQPVEDPEVTITKGMFGSWQLSVVGENSEVKVKRIQ